MSTRIIPQWFSLYPGVAASFVLMFLVLDTTAQSICNRTPQVRDAILELIPNQSNCATVRADQLSRITDLDLTNKGITALKEGDFANLPNLNELDLGNQFHIGVSRISFTTLPPNLFAGLSKLTVLQLDFNSLTSLPEEIFAPLTSLEVLNLGFNTDLQITANLFAGLSSLKRLLLGGTEFPNPVPENLFADLPSLNHLSLSENELTSLPANLFADLSSLSTLHILHNRGLTTLPSGLFNGLTKLRRLNLEGNSLQSLPSDLFNGLINLEFLALSFNSLQRVPSGLLAGLPRLNYVTFYANSLTTLPADFFDGVTPGLETHLALNPIECLPQKILDLFANDTVIEIDTADFSACGPLVTLALSEASILENNGSTTVTATLDKVSTEETTITVTVTPDLPATTDDYTLSTPATLTIASGETSSTGEVTITAVNNEFYTGDKTVQAGGTAMNDEGIMGPDAVELVIEEDEEVPTVTLTVSPSQVSEDAGRTDIVVTATMDVPRLVATEVSVSVEPGTATERVDYEAVTPISVTIAAEAREGTGMFSFKPIPDAENDPAETVLVKGSSDLGAAVEAALTIGNAAPPPAVMLVLDRTTIPEKAGMATVRAQLSAPSNAATTIALSVDPDSPASEDDYRLSGTSLTIPLGDTESSNQVTITAVDNLIPTEDKTFQIGGRATNLRGGAVDPMEVELTITDDDGFTLAVTPLRVAENAGRTDLTVTVTLDAAQSTNTEVRISVGGGSAIEGLDYTAVDPFFLTVPANQMEASTQFPFTPIHDDLEEGEETVAFTGASSQGASAMSILTLVNAEQPPEVTLALTLDTITEDGGRTEVTATLSVPSSAETTIEISVVPDAGDYTLNPTILTIAAGERTSTGGVTITGVDNDLEAPDKTVEVHGMAANEQGIRGPSPIPLTITNDDQATEITLMVAPLTVDEDAGSMQLAVTGMLDVQRSTDTEVMLSVAPETATLGSDYAPVSPSSLTIPANQENGMGSLLFMPIEDQVDEPEETVQVRGTVEGLTVTSVPLTILDQTEDPKVVLVLNSPTIEEDGGRTTVTATLNPVSSTETMITVSAHPNPPATPADYTLEGTTLMIAAGQMTSTGSVTITAIDNAVDTEDKTVLIRGRTTNIQPVMDPEDVELTIEDDDMPTGFTLAVSPLDVGEDEGEVPIMVTARLDIAGSTPTQVTLKVENGTAVSSEDFAAVEEQTFTIPVGAIEATHVLMFTPTPDEVDESSETVLITGTSTVGSNQAILTITDATPAPTVILELAPPSIPETGGRTEVTARLSALSSAPTAITISARPDELATEEDYLLSPVRTLTIEAGGQQSTGLVTITAVDNDVDGPPKIIYVGGRATNDNGVTGPSEQMLTITNEDRATEITLEVTPSVDVSEDVGSTQITVTATMDRARSTDTAVILSVDSGTATLGTDFAPVPPTLLTIPANQTEGTGRFTFTPNVDNLDEPVETVEVRGAVEFEGLHVRVGMLNLYDTNPTPEVTLELIPTTIREEDGEAALRARLSGPSSVPTEITLLALPLSPATQEDYTLPPNPMLTIAPGATISTGEVLIRANDNLIDAPDKTIILGGTAMNANEVTGPADVTLTILNDDQASEITLTVDPPEVQENGGRKEIIVTAQLDVARSVPTEVTLAVEDGTALVGADYEFVPSVELTIAAGAMEGTERFTFTPTADGIHELEETVQVSGQSSLGAATPALLTITETDPVPELKLHLNPNEIHEGERTRITARLSAPSGAETRITLSDEPQLPATTDDYTWGATMLTIAAGETESGEEATITAEENQIFTGDKKVTVRGQVTNAHGIQDPQDVELTILENDTPTGLTLELEPVKVREGDPPTEITVTARLENPFPTETEVTMTVGGGSATLETDYTVEPASMTLTIAADETSNAGTFDLTLEDDLLYEPEETITFTGTSPTRGTVQASLTIEDNDPRVILAIQDTTVLEDVRTAELIVRVDPPAPTGLSVRVQTIPQSATEGEDYVGVDEIITIQEGMERVTIEVEIQNDDFAEEVETFQVQLSDPVGAELEQSAGTVTIEDEDVHLLRIADESELESEDQMTFMVTLNRAHPLETVRVMYATFDGSAIANLDYVPTSGTLNFPPGETTQSVQVRLIPDEDEEMQETFYVALSMPQHAELEREVATGTIQDDDTPPRVHLTPAVTVQEDESPARFDVTLSRAPLQGDEVVVGFIVHDETATRSQDYQVQTESPLRFKSGETTKSIEVEILDDALAEPEETFRVQLTEIQNGEPGQSLGRGFIQDNEEPVMPRIEDAEVNESDPVAVFVVTLSGMDSQPLTFAYMTVDGSATAGEDYTMTAGTVMFAAGEDRKEIEVPILPDEEIETNETFRVRLTGTGMEAEGRILDDDGMPTVSIQDQTASEDAGALLLPVQLSRSSPRLVTIEFASADVTATEGADYVSSRGIVIFEPGSTEGKIRIQILEDEEVEGNETFQVKLADARNAEIDQEGIGIGTIVDNDGGSNVSVQSVMVSRSAAIFEMNLSKPSLLPVLVSYATEDGSAYAGKDYEPVAGQVTFAPGEVSKTIDVKLLSSERIWEAKTFALVILSAVNAEVQEARTEAVMEEESEESILNAYVARVLRTWASQVVEALSRRMEGMAQCQIPDLSWLRYGTEHRSLGQIFSGCGAEFTQGGWSVWGQGAFTRMRGQDGALSLSSDVTTMLVGADYAWRQGWMAGLLAAQSWDQGTYETPSRSGTASSRLTSFYPYVSYQTGAGMRAWMLLGLGRGETELETLNSELDAALIALGLTGTLTGGSTGRLGYEVDAFWATANMETGSDLGVRRVRAGVEGRLRLGAGMEPYLETALRQDGGDAETGLGMELGGGLRWAANQLRAEFGGRTLVLHTDEGLREWGLMGSIEYGTPGGLGPSMRVQPLWGSVYGGDLWREAPLHSVGLGSTDQRVEMELGYGAPIRESLGQSTLGMTVDPRGRTYRVGYNLRMSQGLQVSVATTARTMEANEAPPSYGISARMDLKW